MNKQDSIEFKLRPAPQECWLHQTRLHTAWQEAVNFPSIKDLTIRDSNDVEVRMLDRIVVRFGKLQNLIGLRLLPAILQILQERQENDAFLDKLNRAEKIGVLPSVENWILLRELRNQTDEYPSTQKKYEAPVKACVQARMDWGMPLMHGFNPTWIR